MERANIIIELEHDKETAVGENRGQGEHPLGDQRRVMFVPKFTFKLDLVIGGDIRPRSGPKEKRHHEQKLSEAIIARGNLKQTKKKKKKKLN